MHDDFARRLGFAIKHRPGLLVAVANSARLQSTGVYAATTVGIHGEEFSIDCYMLALDGFDVVLGVQWLKTLGPITWEFKALSMAFQYQGRTILWHGIGGAGVSLAALTATCDLKDTLLLEYSDLFQEPQGLPPSRRHDHRLHLLPGIAPVAVRLYRYPKLLKNEIEHQCDVMLAQGIIRATMSPFSAPVLLVKKHDETWRFGVDFRELNENMVKHNFQFRWSMNSWMSSRGCASSPRSISAVGTIKCVCTLMMWLRQRSALITGTSSSSLCPLD
jgi:hypothetical protein